jgi:putative CRISPR-associated protein (TIGR02619 family)
MKTIICTTGTSIAGGTRFAGDAEGYRRDIRVRIEQVSKEKPNDFLKIISAETNSLSQVSDIAVAQIVLLHTETEDGRICAETLADTVMEHLTSNVKRVQISGLQVKDEKVFRRDGIQNLFQALNRTLDSISDKDVVLNVTGGFKSVVPYITLFGLINRLDVIYIHETANSLMHLPPLPLSFDFELLGEIRDAMLKLRKEGLMQRQAFLKLIRNRSVQQEAWLRSLIEEEGDMVAPSALAALFFREQDTHTCRVMISDKARESLDTSSGGVRRQYLGMLERVSDPLWRDSKHHPLTGTDLIGIKPGRTGERMLIFLREQTVYVCELAVHDRYEEIARTRRIKDYENRQFEQWVMPAGEQVEVSEEAEMDRLRRENETAEKMLEEASARVESVESQLQAANLLKADLQVVTKDRESLREENASLQARNKDLERMLSAARLPWWKRLFR